MKRVIKGAIVFMLLYFCIMGNQQTIHTSFLLFSRKSTIILLKLIIISYPPFTNYNYSFSL